MTEQPSWTLSRVAVYDATRIYVLAYSKREPGTRVFRWSGRWDNYHVKAVTAGICAVRGPNPEILTLGADGCVHRAGPGGQTYESVTEEQSPKAGLLRDIRPIGGEVYATGLGRQVHVRRSQTWQPCDEGVVAVSAKDDLSGFESIDGFDADELYAVGRQGEIWMRERGVWRRTPSPVKTILENVLCAPDGTVYISGQLGVVLRGRKGEWSRIEHGLTEETFWDMAWFDGHLWLSTTDGLYRLESETLDKVRTGLPEGQTFRYLDAHGDVLCSAGERDLALFDGRKWERIPSP